MSARIGGRLTLVERSGGQSPPGSPRVRRYSLARIAPSPVSALGVDRLEQMERVADLTRAAAERPGADPGPGR